MLSPLEVLRLYPEHDFTLPGALESRLSAGGARSFMLYGERVWTWQQFADGVTRAACGLAKRGIGRGDRVAIVERNSASHILLLCALARLRAIMVPVNPEFGVGEATYVLAHAAVKAVFVGPDMLSTVRAAIAEIDDSPWIALTVPGEKDLPTLDDLIATPADTADLPSDVAPDDTAVIIYTSGTTGYPKGVMHSHRNFLLAGEAFVQRVHLNADDRAMIILPLFHMNALFYSVAGTLAAGASMVVIPKFSASTFWEAAAESGATVVNIIEAIGKILEVRPRSEFRPDHQIRAVYGVRENVAKTFREEFGIRNLLCGFGMTEIPGVTCNPYGAPRKPGSMGVVGAHPDPNRTWAECRVVDDQGSNSGANEVGELWVKTPIVMQGYYRDPEQTEDTFEDGWFKTGDLVSRDEDGWYTFVSRKKDIIRRRGENIAAAELDRVIGEHPDVFEVAAIAVPSELGEDDILVAVAVIPGKLIDAEEIAAWCRERLAPIKVPRFVVFLDELPHTATHKVAKAVLRDDETLRDRAVDLQPNPTAGQQQQAALQAEPQGERELL